MIENGLVLSIFPGIDLLGQAFENEGFCVVRGPDLIWGGDIRDFHPPPHTFEGVIGGPPCVGESNLANLNNGHPGFTLWNEAKRVIDEAKPLWWMLEAVIKKPAPFVIKLSPRYLGEKQSRKRYFHSNLNIPAYIEVALFDNPVKKLCVIASQKSGAKGTVKRGIATYDFPEMCELQGLPRDYDIPGLLMVTKQKVIGNAVPLSMGTAIAKSIIKAKGDLDEGYKERPYQSGI